MGFYASLGLCLAGFSFKVPFHVLEPNPVVDLKDI